MIHLGSVDDGSSQPKRDKRVTTRSHGLTEYLPYNAYNYTIAGPGLPSHGPIFPSSTSTFGVSPSEAGAGISIEAGTSGGGSGSDYTVNAFSGISLGGAPYTGSATSQAS